MADQSTSKFDSDFGIGLVCAMLAALGKGTFLIFYKIRPVRKLKVDQFVFHLYLCSGWMLVALVMLPLLRFNSILTKAPAEANVIQLTWRSFMVGFMCGTTGGIAFLAVSYAGVSIGHAIWTGLNSMCSYIGGVLIFGDKITCWPMSIAGLLMIVGGSVTLGLLPYIDMPKVDQTIEWLTTQMVCVKKHKNADRWLLGVSRQKTSFALELISCQGEKTGDCNSRNRNPEHKAAQGPTRGKRDHKAYGDDKEHVALRSSDTRDTFAGSRQESSLLASKLSSVNVVGSTEAAAAESFAIGGISDPSLKRADSFSDILRECATRGGGRGGGRGCSGDVGTSVRKSSVHGVSCSASYTPVDLGSPVSTATPPEDMYSPPSAASPETATAKEEQDEEIVDEAKTAKTAKSEETAKTDVEEERETLVVGRNRWKFAMGVFWACCVGTIGGFCMVPLGTADMGLGLILGLSTGGTCASVCCLTCRILIFGWRYVYAGAYFKEAFKWGFICGVVWIAYFSVLLCALKRLNFCTTFLITDLAVIMSTLWSVYIFKEVEGKGRMLLCVLLTFVLFGGAALLVFSSQPAA